MDAKTHRETNMPKAIDPRAVTLLEAVQKAAHDIAPEKVPDLTPEEKTQFAEAITSGFEVLDALLPIFLPPVVKAVRDEVARQARAEARALLDAHERAAENSLPLNGGQ
jgi:hypothetical protein